MRPQGKEREPGAGSGAVRASAREGVRACVRFAPPAPTITMCGAISRAAWKRSKYGARRPHGAPARLSSSGVSRPKKTSTAATKGFSCGNHKPNRLYHESVGTCGTWYSIKQGQKIWWASPQKQDSMSQDSSLPKPDGTSRRGQERGETRAKGRGACLEALVCGGHVIFRLWQKGQPAG